eukprot:gene837-8588_t
MPQVHSAKAMSDMRLDRSRGRIARGGRCRPRAGRHSLSPPALAGARQGHHYAPGRAGLPAGRLGAN